MTIAEFAFAVVTYALKMNASCESWGRTLKHNAAVGGVLGSPHTHWLGADLIYDDPAVYQQQSRFDVARQLGLEIIFEQNPLHDHLQPVGWQNYV